MPFFKSKVIPTIFNQRFAIKVPNFPQISIVSKNFQNLQKYGKPKREIAMDSSILSLRTSKEELTKIFEAYECQTRSKLLQSKFV